jgi:hypothetical protein
VLEAVTDLARQPFEDKAAASVLLATDVCRPWEAGASPACVHLSASFRFDGDEGSVDLRDSFRVVELERPALLVDTVLIEEA